MRYLTYIDRFFETQHKLAVTVLQCLQNRAPKYLVDCCVPVSDVATRQHLALLRHHLTVPRYRRITFGRRAFSVGPDDLERTARRSPRPVAQCRGLPVNVKGSIVHQILVYSARLKCCMK